MGARPLPEIYCFIYPTSGFAGLVSIYVLYLNCNLSSWPVLSRVEVRVLRRGKQEDYYFDFIVLVK
jgi:hypothetical protein